MAKQTGKSTDGFLVGGTNGTFTYDDFVRTVPYNGRNGLLLLFTTDPATIQSTQTSTNPASCTSNYVQALLSTEIPPSFMNLSRVQHKLLHIHERMGHLGLDEIQHPAHTGYFGDSLHSIGSCEKPLCHAGKAQKRPISTTSTPIKATHVHPGDCESCDQLESNAPGH